MKNAQLVIVGGGPAGLAAAVSAYDSGIKDILILERDHELGGILNQCIHNGFGLHTFKEELTGPEYAQRFIDKAIERKIPYLLNTMVMDVSRDKVVTAMNSTDGMFEIKAEAVIFAMGCRERPRGALNIPGYRPAGIFSAGTAQRLVNMEGYMPGREVVILGSGDIGLIMARRMTLEGAKVKVVAELMPYSGGLKRNIVQCLDDYGIPLKLSHTVVDIKGRERVEGVTIAQVDEKNKPIPGTEEEYKCDTLLLSCGLIPENELSRSMGVKMDPVTGGPFVDESLQTDIPGVFACGNVLHVHDLVDYVSEEAGRAGIKAAEYINMESKAAEYTKSAEHVKSAEHFNMAENSEKADENGVESNNPKYTDEKNAMPDDKSSTVETGNYLPEGGQPESSPIEILATDGVRYTVPRIIHMDRMDDNLTVRFRVGRVFKDSFISVYLDDERILHRKKQVIAPGEMEQVILQKKLLNDKASLKQIRVCIEEE